MKKKKKKLMMTRRQVLKAGMIGGAGLMMPLRFLPAKAFAVDPTAACNILGCTNFTLSDPANQNLFANPVPDALDPSFIYQPDSKGRYKIHVGTAIQQTGLVDSGGIPLDTPIWGYGAQSDKVYTWPGRTFEIQRGATETTVIWENKLTGVAQHLLPVDTSLHWCYSLPGYTKNTIAKNGVPIITHLHGGHTDFQFDGNPEFFYGPKGGGNGKGNMQVIGPQWDNVPGGFTTKFRYDNNVPAGNLWYHDHALGLTRLNVYAGLAGFYFVRDNSDTGLPSNPLGLPAGSYEKAYAIQDRMFKNTGELFYPAFPGDPYYDDFITGEGAILPPDIFPGGGPTALAEFFGDHMVVNGVIWPYENVEPRNYRLHLLNGTDSRFMAIRFRLVSAGATTIPVTAPILPFDVIGSDQGLASSATTTSMLLSEPGSRYDIVFDFKGQQGKRIIMENIGGDEPFGGDLVTDDPDLQIFDYTDRIMAFDVEDVGDQSDPYDPVKIDVPSNVGAPTRWRKVALFEGKDEFGRLQPLLGTAEPATNFEGARINWPNTQPYIDAGLIGQMNGSIAWHSPTTENPALGITEEWEVWNATGDAHPVHLHLVHFEIVGRKEIKWDSNTVEDDRVLDPADAAGNGTYLVTQPVVQHNGEEGKGFRIVNPTYLPGWLSQPAGYVENAPKDMVTALPDQVTFIRATFDKPGRYVWHCHILSHEDHEMMRVLHVGPGA